MPTIIGFDEKHKKKISCRHCSAINEYTLGEVKTLWSGTDYGGGPDGAEGFNCANCGKQIITNRW